MVKIKKYIKQHPYFSQILICLIVGLIVSIPVAIFYMVRDIVSYHNSFGESIASFFVGGMVFMVICFIFLYPFVVTVYQVIRLIMAIKAMKNKDADSNLQDGERIASMLYDLFVIFTGIVLEMTLLMVINSVNFMADWYVQLSNAEIHTPINSENLATFFVIGAMYTVGMIVLALTPRKRPPLITVLSISGMYMGIIEAVVFTVQIMGIHTIRDSGEVYSLFNYNLLFTLLLPINLILIMLRMLFIEISAYKPDDERMSKIDNVPVLGALNRMLNNSKNWPLAAFILMIPMLGIIIAILALAGQAPNSAIKAFTETADYTLSTKIPPQNIYYDEHYLCTVAAGGHEKVVKPIRMGKRHGHDVVVNRQLMIANAFEQILEEKTPKFHRAVRDFYDTYGFPIARLIKSKYVADAIWIIMKPLEWIFLFVIYMVDVNPEDRIASQYL